MRCSLRFHIHPSTTTTTTKRRYNILIERKKKKHIMMRLRSLLALCLFFLQGPFGLAFIVTPPSSLAFGHTCLLSVASDSSAADTKSGAGDEDANELIAKRVIVSGNVQGGYVRACILNEAGKFRRLVGTMTDPDTSSDTAEIYVEGKRKLVDGFVRWCKRGNIGLSQAMKVLEVIDEEPTGLYESFYCKTK
eukprot:scaffold1803_cov92-Amphora_coffeaeformis.AAC.79